MPNGAALVAQHRSPAGLRAPVKTCRYNGTVYQSGETFASHELFPSRQENQEQLRGRAVRATPSTVRGSPRGLNLQSLRLKGAAGTTVKILMQKKHQKACVYSGKTYSHGDVWHPVLGKVLDCILCTCRDGVQECKRITCPSQYPCPHPEKTQGKCCKTCPELKEETNKTQCLLEQDSNSLLVYKVEPSSEAGTEDSAKIIAIERQGVAEVEVQVWKTVEETWKKFKEDENKGKEFPKSRTCEEGIKEVVKFLNPGQLDSLCAS
ncbi:hypothetical protein JZ751_023140 [Albula glossodonta]|uniref:VWFC domain-containing protein n=1 Tax=Albula glossodonta TaxID=121402 RepID=A0A8T2PI74_9TELE|nr:hypothetical protein JZ751_023140 [Albula glossodonta]